MLIPLGAKGSHSLLSLWLACGAGRWRGQFKRSPCCSPHDRPAAPGQVKATCSGSGRAAWRPGLRVRSLGGESSSLHQPCPVGLPGSPPETPQGDPAPCRVQPWSHVAPGLIGSLGTQEQVPHRRERAQGQDHRETVTEEMGKPNVSVEETHRIQLCNNIVPKNDNVSATDSVKRIL